LLSVAEVAEDLDMLVAVALEAWLLLAQPLLLLNHIL
jgi:hypothetical protein